MIVCPVCGRSDRVNTVPTRYGQVRNSCCNVWSWGQGSPMVSRDTHDARKRAHAMMDPLWKKGLAKRKHVYRAMSKVLDLDRKDCHMKVMDEETATMVVEKFILSLKEVELMLEDEDGADEQGWITDRRPAEDEGCSFGGEEGNLKWVVRLVHWLPGPHLIQICNLNDEPWQPVPLSLRTPKPIAKSCDNCGNGMQVKEYSPQNAINRSDSKMVQICHFMKSKDAKYGTPGCKWEAK